MKTEGGNIWYALAFCSDADFCINVIVDPESKKALRSLVESLVPMVLHVAMVQGNGFIFL